MSDTFAQVPEGQQAPDRYRPIGPRVSSTRGLFAQVPEGQRVPSRYPGAPSGPVGDRVATYTQGWNLLEGPMPANPGEVDLWIRRKYPFMAAFLDHPEVGPILREAALVGAGEAELYGALQTTRWWQGTSSAARQWEALVAEDPAEASRLASQTAANIQNRARSLGLNVSAGTISSIALTATKNGWTDNQIVDNLLKSVNWASLQGGDLTALRDTVKSIGANYLVNVSDATAQDYAARIASGEMSEAGVASVMQRQAKSRFSWMADQIDQGVTPRDYFLPIRDVISQELEIAPEAIDLMDPKWMGMLEVPGEDGQPRAATRREAMLSARKQPEWRSTNRAQELMAQAAAGIRDVFGRRAI